MLLKSILATCIILFYNPLYVSKSNNISLYSMLDLHHAYMVLSFYILMNLHKLAKRHKFVNLDCAFICDNMECVLDDADVCNAVDDCGDLSDEINECRSG